MSLRHVPLVRGAALASLAFLLLAGRAPAGGAYRSPPPPPPRPQPAPVARPQPRTAVVVIVTVASQPEEPFTVGLRGPDGQVRRFPVEGGPAAIRYRQVTVRPGESLTLHVAPAR